MRDMIICTVGTSLISNIMRLQEGNLKSMFVSRNVIGLAKELRMLPPDERTCGAEINSTNSIITEKLASPGILCLLVSDTDDGRLTGEILKRYFHNNAQYLNFQNVFFEEVVGLTDSDAKRFKNTGLKNLVRAIAQKVKDHGSDRILINATGGYKAQISFAGMIGQALHIPVCYQFERFSTVIILPPQPISFDMTLWLKHSSFFFELAGDKISDTALQLPEESFGSLVEQIEDKGEFLFSLSPTGLLFHESFLHQFEQQKHALLPSPAHEKGRISFEDDNHGKHKGLDKYLQKILELPYVTYIYTHYFNPDLPRRNTFRKSLRGISHIEGWFSADGALTKFDVLTTAQHETERQACITDLCIKMP